ncbi:MAG: hypothetical protein K6E73_10800 [Bacteroidales bacterium]|nr:hypothetical protein [Bacteroidales bacterium]
MATKTKSEILADVRLILDEQRVNTPLLEEQDVISEETDTLFWSYIEQAVDEVHLQAQAYLLADVVEHATVNVAADSPRYGKRGVLPDDFLRCIRIMAADWMQPVYEPIDPSSDEYQLQRSKWQGVRGNAERPVVAVTTGSTAGSAQLQIEVYDTAEGSVTVDYVPRAEVSTDEDPEVEVGLHCYRPLLYVLAKHYLLTLGDSEKATIFGATAGGLLGTEPPADAAATG